MPRTADGAPTGVAYTTEVPPHRYDDPSISTTAHLFQARVVAHHHLRVTAVGRRLFGTAIHHDGELDWRRNPEGAGYRVLKVTGMVRVGVHRLLESLGLAFGAFDFIVTESGHPVFLEVNANGQWGWIENHTGQPIARALANLLTGREP